MRLRWRPQPGITRYRLQIARDEKFSDIIFDRAVVGTEYEVTDLLSGRYYWRVAPAAGETGRFTNPESVLVSEPTSNETGAGKVPVIANENSGWRAATGDVAQPLAAPLRSVANLDLIAVNSDGMVYALDGASGAALWTARFRPSAQRGEPTGSGGAQVFTPVMFSSKSGLANVVVAFDGGVRALEGATGRELWRASLKGRPTAGAAADLRGDGAQEIILAQDNSPALLILSGENGKILSETKLDAAVKGAPAIFSTGGQSRILVALDGGAIELRDQKGELQHGIKLDTNFTTPPLVVEVNGSQQAFIGIETGMIALDAVKLDPLGRIEAEKTDAPRGILTYADLDRDGLPEIAMITESGRVVIVNSTDKKIRWHAAGAKDAASAAFADIDGDGTLDVLVAAGTDFAYGLSGRDGSLIWKASEIINRTPATDAPKAARSLVAVRAANISAPFLVGSDTAHIGLRAVALPAAGAAQSAVR